MYLFLQIAMVSPSVSSCEHSLNTLRYADRVKELGAADPAQNKGSPAESPEARMDDGVLSPEDSDLAQLRSLNEGELSADWYNFQVSKKMCFCFAVNIDPRGRPQSWLRLVVITIFTQCPSVRPKTSKSSDNHCRTGL